MQRRRFGQTGLDVLVQQLDGSVFLLPARIQMHEYDRCQRDEVDEEICVHDVVKSKKREQSRWSAFRQAFRKKFYARGNYREVFVVDGARKLQQSLSQDNGKRFVAKL
jgi:hypothetical protein